MMQSLRAFHIKDRLEVVYQIPCKKHYGLVYEGSQERNSEPDIENIRRVMKIKQVLHAQDL